MNFPNSPTIGDLHVDGGHTWEWIGDRWSIVGDALLTTGLEYMESSYVGNGNVPSDQYAVIGDMLWQWGIREANAYAYTVTWAIPYDAGVVPTVQANTVGLTGGGQQGVVSVVTPTETQVLLYTLYRDGSANMNPIVSNTPVSFLVVGPAPASMVKPKEFLVLYGSGEGGAVIQEFHDPAGLASWRIMGETLECWGTYTVASSETEVTLPKTYANTLWTPTFGYEEGGNTRAYSVGESLPHTVNQMWIKARRSASDSEGDAIPVHWHTRGKWDGIS